MPPITSTWMRIEMGIEMTFFESSFLWVDSISEFSNMRGPPDP
jgi:hypothetical protein